MMWQVMDFQVTCLCHETNVKANLCSVFFNDLIRHASYMDSYSVVL